MSTLNFYNVVYYNKSKSAGAALTEIVVLKDKNLQHAIWNALSLKSAYFEYDRYIVRCAGRPNTTYVRDDNWFENLVNPVYIHEINPENNNNIINGAFEFTMTEQFSNWMRENCVGKYELTVIIAGRSDNDSDGPKIVLYDERDVVKYKMFWE